MSLKFQSLNSRTESDLVLLQYKIILESLENSENHKGKNKISTSPGQLSTFWCILFYMYRWVYTFFLTRLETHWMLNFWFRFFPTQYYIISIFLQVSPNMVMESNNGRHPGVKGLCDFRREIMILMPAAFALKGDSLKLAWVEHQRLHVGWGEQRRESAWSSLNCLWEVPSHALCAWIPPDGAGQLVFEVRVKNAKQLLHRPS